MFNIDLTKKIIHFESLDSTNDYIKNHYKTLENYTVIKTNFQTKGRGQFERTWESKSQENLLFSILIKDRLPFPKEDVNPILISSIIESLEDYGINATFKEPNDIYIGSRKMAGILIETKYDEHTLVYMVIGIGLNVNQINFLTENAISMKQILNKDINLNILLMTILSNISNKINIKNRMNLGE